MSVQKVKRGEPVKLIRTVLDERIPDTAYRLLLAVFVLLALSYGSFIW